MNDICFRRTVLAATVTGTLLLAACGGDDDATSAATAAPATTAGGASGTTGSAAAPSDQPVSGTINGSGATSQAAAMQAWVAGFQQHNPDAQINYDPVGSGGGRTAFLAGGADFAGSDAALSDDDFAASKEQCGADGAIDLPHYISPIAIAYNLPGVTTLRLTPDTAAGIFSGQIKKWNDPKLAADNAGVTLPDKAINPVHRSDESGTTQNFTDYLRAAAPSVWSKEAAQDWPDGFGGEGAQGTSGVVAAIKAGEGSVGYADASQVQDLGVARIKVGNDFVELSAEAAAKAVEVSDKVPGRNQYDVSFELNRTPTEPGVYPITLVSYHIVCQTYKDAAKAELVKAFMGYVGARAGQDAAAQAAGSAPMTPELQQQVATAVSHIAGG